MTGTFTDPHIGLVVEGAGDRGAVPVLLRAYLHSVNDYRDVLGRPVPAHGRDKALRKGGLEGFVATAASRPGCVGVLVVLDGEGDPVSTLGPELLVRAQSVTGKPVFIALADCDFESWLYASAETLDLNLMFDESCRGQGEIAAAIRPAKYVKPTWQPRLTGRMDLQLAKGRSKSLCYAFEQFEILRGHLPSFT